MPFTFKEVNGLLVEHTGFEPVTSTMRMYVGLEWLKKLNIN